MKDGTEPDALDIKQEIHEHAQRDLLEQRLKEMSTVDLVDYINMWAATQQSSHTFWPWLRVELWSEFYG